MRWGSGGCGFSVIADVLPSVYLETRVSRFRRTTKNRKNRETANPEPKEAVCIFVGKNRRNRWRTDDLVSLSVFIL